MSKNVGEILLEKEHKVALEHLNSATCTVRDTLRVLALSISSSFADKYTKFELFLGSCCAFLRSLTDLQGIVRKDGNCYLPHFEVCLKTALTYCKVQVDFCSSALAQLGDSPRLEEYFDEMRMLLAKVNTGIATEQAARLPEHSDLLSALKAQTDECSAAFHTGVWVRYELSHQKRNSGIFAGFSASISSVKTCFSNIYSQLTSERPSQGSAN